MIYNLDWNWQTTSSLPESSQNMLYLCRSRTDKPKQGKKASLRLATRNKSIVYSDENEQNL